jgi:transposase-like protein
VFDHRRRRGSDVDKESLQELLDQGVSIERIAKRFGKDPSTVSYWMKKFGLESPYKEKHAAKGGIERERLEALIKAGMTIAEIAEEVSRSKATVRHWLRRYGLRTQNGVGTRRPGVAAAARDAGLLNTTMTCPRHGETEFVLEGRGHYRCKQCRVQAVTRHRRKIKAELVKEAGGRCCICGYYRCVGALEFHHLDPSEKLHEVSRYGVTLSLAAAREEASKCVLLCSNCHAEVERGVVRLPATVAATSDPPIPGAPG